MKRKVIGYLRVSTIDQNNDKFESDILRFANNHEFGKVVFVSEKISGCTSWKNRKLFQVVESMTAGDIIIVPELSRIGRSTLDILEVLKRLSEKHVKVYSVKENFEINGSDIQSKMMRTLLSLFSEIERDLISQRTKEGLAQAKLKGKFGGRPKGAGKSKLDEFRPEIVSLLSNGSTKTFVSKRYHTTAANLNNWLKMNEIQINVKQ